MFLEINENQIGLNNLSKKHISFNKQTINNSDIRTDNHSSPQLELEHVSAFGKKAQALTGGYDYEYLKNVTEHKAFENIKVFEESKPSVDKKSIKIYSYRTNLKGDFSKYQCVWYKLKSPEVIDHTLNIPKIGNRVAPEKILEFAFNEAKKIVPDAAIKVDEMGYKFTFDSENMKTGFSWIASNITIEIKRNRNIYIKTPTLITNKIVPSFGGMSYCKVFTPNDAANILVDIANGNFNKLLKGQTNRGI